MLKSNQELKIFSIKKSDMNVFAREAKSYGVLYCALINKENKNIDNMVDIMVRADDAPKVNRIITRFSLTTVDKATVESQTQKEKQNIAQDVNDDLTNDLVDTDKEEKVSDKMIDDLFSEPSNTEEKQVPLLEKKQENQLEDLSMTKNLEMKPITNVNSIETKKSVRMELKEIAQAQKKEQLNKMLEEKKIDNSISDLFGNNTLNDKSLSDKKQVPSILQKVEKERNS